MHHKEGCRDPLSADVCHDKPHFCLTEHKEVIEVSADLPGRLHGSINIKICPVREGREAVRQHVRLNAVGEGEFRMDSLFLSRHLCQIFLIILQVMLHIRQNQAQVFHLVAGLNIQAAEVFSFLSPFLLVPAVGLRRLRDAVDRPDQPFPDPAFKDEGHQNHQQNHRKGILQDKQTHRVGNLAQRDIRKNIAVDPAVIAPDGITAGAEPSVLFRPADVIELAFPVPVQKGIQLFLLDLLPVSGMMDRISFRIHDIDQGGCVFVIHRKVHVVHVA